MYDWNGDWESYEYTVKDIDVYNNDANDANYENYEHDESNDESNESDEHNESNEHNESDEHKESNEHSRKKIIEEITKEIIGSYVNYLIHDDNKSDSTDHEDCLESGSEDDEDEDESDSEDNDNNSDEDVKSLDSDENDTSDKDEDDKGIDSDEDESDNEICKEKILLNCCTLYIIMLSIYVNTILCTYIALRC